MGSEWLCSEWEIVATITPEGRVILKEARDPLGVFLLAHFRLDGWHHLALAHFTPASAAAERRGRTPNA